MRLQSVVSSLVARDRGVQHVPSHPVAVELVLDELHDPLLLCLDSCLLLPEPVQLGLPLSDLPSQVVDILNPRVGVLPPDVQNGNEDVSPQVLEGLGCIDRQLSLVVLVAQVIESTGGELEEIAILGLLIALQQPRQLLLGELLLQGLVDLLAPLIEPKPHHVLHIRGITQLYLIVIAIHVVPQLQSVGVNDPEVLVQHHPRAPLLRLLLVPVPGLHVLPREVALVELEAGAVPGEGAREDLALHLLHELVDGVAEDEVALERWVGVQIQVHEQPPFLGIMLAQPLHCKAGRLKHRIGLGVKPVEVLIEFVHPAVSPGDPIRVEHGHQHEHEVLPQQVGPGILLIEEEPDDPQHAERGGSLNRVHSSRNEDDRLIASELRHSLPLERRHLDRLPAVPALVRGDLQAIDDPALVRLGELVVLQEYLRVVCELAAEPRDVLPAVLVGIGVGECELHAEGIGSKQIVEFKHDLSLHWPQGQDGVGQPHPLPVPFLLPALAINGPIELALPRLLHIEVTRAERK